MTTIMQLDTKKACEQPETVFRTPADVVAEIGLTRGQKVVALKRWAQLLDDRLRASNEGMTPPAGQGAREAATIEAIGKALVELDALKPQQ